MRQRFSRLCLKEGGADLLREQTIEFVAAVRAARAEVSRVDASAAWAAAERACRTIAATFLVPGSAVLDDATRVSALGISRGLRPGGDAAALLDSLAHAEETARARQKLESVRRELTTASARATKGRRGGRR